MKRLGVLISTTIALLFAASSSAKAGTITFEADMGINGYVPQDELVISNQFEADFGVTFSLDIDDDGFADAGAFPTLEQTGTYPNDSVAFASSAGFDRAVSGFEDQLGEFFLKMPNFFSESLQVNPSLIINYANPTAAASGEIWDIDGLLTNPVSSGYEQWQIAALAQDFSVIDTIISDNVDLDGKPWEWSFDRSGTADIFAIRISSIGTAPGGGGFAFNNFSPAGAPPENVPEPTGIIGLLLFGGTIAGLKRKPRNQA